MGKRQLGELELSELVVAILISDMAANPLQNTNIPLLNGIIPLIILLCLEIIISGLEFKSVRFRAFLCGKPSILIRNGKIVQNEMRKNRITLDELAEEMRIQCVPDLSKIETGILETDGSISLQLYPSEQPASAGEMNIKTEDKGLPVILINDGILLKDNLKMLKLSEEWLRTELNKRKLKSVKEVYLLSVNKLGQIYFLKKEKE